MDKLKVAVPAHALRANALPTLGICPRHGQAATRTRKRTFYTATPWWCYLFILAGFLVAVLVIVSIRKQVSGPVPECTTCVSERQRYRGAVTAAWVGSIVVCLVALAKASTGLVLLTCLLGIAALVLSATGDRFRVSGVLSTDQGWLELKGVHPAFVQASHQAMQQAAQAQPVYAGYPGYGVAGTT